MKRINFRPSARPHVIALLFLCLGRASYAGTDCRAPDLSDINIRDIMTAAKVPAIENSVPANKMQSAQERVDLGWQFPAEAKDLNQQDVGACNIFAAISILEAAYKRHYDKSVKFSEADLFLRHVVLGVGIYENLLFIKFIDNF